MCEHKEFAARVAVNRLENENGGHMQFVADITIRCKDCDLPFQFLGLTAGLDLQGATVGIDGLEARLAICPQGSQPNPLQRMAFNIKKFDG